ncbi:MAG TPA: response regulator transcription factor [Chitinophagaceae bacterium]|nr:response regulator transcription factor [Chitinophagaceae bacterium]
MEETPVKIISLLIVDDHQMVRDGIKVMLESKENFLRFEIDEAENGEIAIRKILKKDFDIVLIDYQLPGMSGTETLQKIRLYKKDIKVLALSNYDEISQIKSMLNEGVNGYILKNIEPSQLIQAIQSVLEGIPYYSNEVAIKLIDSAKNSEKTIAPEKSGLTKRELEILKMIALEMTNDQIAKSLFISKRTVDTHRQNLLNKLNVKNTAGLIKAAYEFNLL